MAIALRYAARSDLGLGPKSRNEDSGYAGPNLLVLADGMGGHAAGDVASSMIVGELAPLDEEDVTADQAIPLLEEALHSANAKLTKAMRENSDLAGMGSTTIVMLRTGNKLAMAHIGDSRAFMLRGDTFSQITKDHSFVQQLIDEGRISKEDAGHHPQRSVVTRVMTGQPGRRARHLAARGQDRRPLPAVLRRPVRLRRRRRHRGDPPRGAHPRRGRRPLHRDRPQGEHPRQRDRHRRRGRRRRR